MTDSRRMRLLVATALVLTLMTQTRAQQPPGPAAVIKIDVNLVQVDAVVTDSRGRPVTDLTVEDFELLQDGQPQKITSFDFIKIIKQPPQTAPEVSLKARSRETDVPPPTQITQLKADQIQRTIAIVVDDLALSFDSAVRVRESLKKWVDREMAPGDLVAIVRTRSGMGSMQRFSMEKPALLSAIDLIRSGPGRVGVSSFEALRGPLPTDGVLDTSRFDDEVAHAYLTGSLAAIRDVIRGLRELPGRKSLILFTEDMRFTFLEGNGIPTRTLTTRTGEEYMRRIADEANRSSVVIHAVDPRGVVYTGLTAEDNANVIEETQDEEGNTVAAPPGPGIAARINQRADQLIASRDGMVELTRRTGGLFAPSSNDIGASLRRVVDDGDGYYLLGYQPDLSTFEVNQQSAFHNIKVRVKRPGLTVRSRSGFFGRPDTQNLPEAEVRRNQLTKALTSPFASGDVRVRLTGLFYPTEKETAVIKALFHFDARDVTFTDSPEGLKSAEVDIVAVTFDGEGEAIDTVARKAKLEVPKDTYPELLKTGFVYSVDVPLKKPGAYQLRAVLRDGATQRLGSAMEFVNVPDFKNGRLTLSSIVMAEEFRTQANGGPAQAPRSGQPGTPALRVFRPGATLAFGYQVLNPRTDADKKTQLDSRVRLFRNGQQIYDSAYDRVEQDKPLAYKWLNVGGSLQLSMLQPGSYVLQVIVRDNLRHDKYTVAAQATDFEVQDTVLEVVPAQSR